MCRMIRFVGDCTRCGDTFVWDDLTQQLSCLEAKNNGAFGECTKGVAVEDHPFDQECDACTNEDEGIGDLDPDGEAMDNDITLVQGTSGKRSAAEVDDESGERKKQRT